MTEAANDVMAIATSMSRKLKNQGNEIRANEPKRPPCGLAEYKLKLAEGITAAVYAAGR